MIWCQMINRILLSCSILLNLLNLLNSLGKTNKLLGLSKELVAQHPPRKGFDTWIEFFDHPYKFLGTLSPCVMVHKVSTARYLRYLLET